MGNIPQIQQLIKEGAIQQAYQMAKNLEYPERLLGEGIVQYHWGNIPVAEEKIRKYMEIEPDCPICHYYMGNIQIEKSNLPKAVSFLKKAVEGEEKAEYYNDLGYALFLNGNIDDAIKNYMKAVELDPHLSTAFYNLGLAYRRLGDYKNAVKFYNKAVALNPEEPDYYYNVGIVYRLKGEPEKAIKSYLKAIQLNSENENYYNNLGNAYYDLGMLDKAIESYKRAVEINPSFFLGWQNLANTYLDAGMPQQAVKAFKKAIKLNKRCGECYMDMGIALKELGRYEEAKKSYEKAIEINPSLKADGLYNLACLYAVQGKKEKAKKLLQEAFKLDRNLEKYAQQDDEVKELV